MPSKASLGIENILFSTKDEMMKTTERTLLRRDFTKREIVSTGWSIPGESNPLEKGKASFRSWDADITKYEEIFSKYVYDNENLHDADLRQHRAILYGLISHGEYLAVEMLCLENTEAKTYVALIDAKVDTLKAVLLEWHGSGSINDASDIPDSFKEASRQVAAGDLEDFEDDMISEDARS